MISKNSIFFLFFLIYFQVSWGNTNFSERMGAFEFNADYTADFLVNMHGGIETGSTYLGFARLNANLDLEQAGFWRGANLFMMGASTHGAEPTSTLIGDFQAVSNIEAGDLIYIQELWFSQRIGKVTATIGVQDLNVAFLVSEGGSNFINSSFGVNSTIADNIPSPIFPLTGLGLTIECALSDAINVKGAIYDGDLLDFDQNKYNTQWDFSLKQGFLSIGELQFNKRWGNNLSGTYKVGGYLHCGKTGEVDEPSSLRNTGMYAMVDQLVYTNPNTGKEIALFAQWGCSPKKYNNNHGYIGFGSTLKGLCAKRPDDTFGVGVATALFDNHVYQYESTIELTYSAQLSSAIRIQPDLQYVIHPSGSKVELANATVGIVRMEITF